MTETLRPLSNGELLDRAFSYYRSHFVLFAGIAAIPGLISLAYQLSRLVGPLSGGGQLVTALLGLVSLLVSIVSASLVHGATVVAVSQLQLGRETNIAEAFATVRPRLVELILLGLAAGIRIIGGLILFIVPGILLGLSYSLAIPVAVLEDTGGSDALNRSATLTKGSRGRVFLIYCLVFLLTFIGTMIWQVIATVFVTRPSAGFRAISASVGWQVTVMLGSFVSQALVGPIATIALTLVYYDERIRKEAFDLQHMMEHLESADPPAVR